MKLDTALFRAVDLRRILAPHCERILIAGSIRRQKAEVKDIELVCIPKRGGGMFGEDFSEGFTTAVHRCLQVQKGSAVNGRYIKGFAYSGTKVDLFTCTPDNWGYILTLRTGSAEHNIKLVQRLAANGYRCKDGQVWWRGTVVPLPTEFDVFRRAGLPWTEPKDRV